MRLALPAVFVMTPLIWLWLSRHLRGRLTLELPQLGPWRQSEALTLGVFALTALAWMTRSEPFGDREACPVGD